MKSFIIFGILLLGICRTVCSKPTDMDDVEGMQSDDYNYADDDTADPGTSKPSKPANFKGSKAYFANKNSTVTAFAGKDIKLQCDVINLTNEVVLWYKGENIVASGGNVLLPMYAVDNATHTLTVIKATDKSQGEYSCELKPGNKRLYTKVVISHEPLDVVVAPESSPSMQHNSGSSPAATCSIILLTTLFVKYSVLRL